MQWSEVCEHPSLRDLPFKIETNEKGEIVMNAVKVIHSLYQGEIEYLLRSLLKDGRALPECAIRTRKGTRVADVAWASHERIRIIRGETDCSIAPEICIEVRSGSNTADEMAEKRALYFECGALEVWLCIDGVMSFYAAGGQLQLSQLAPEFPARIRLDD
ncbi:Uma2 family endonuclease [Allochromatium palmeri]|uniref:Uma2 family endonuclease n=1 Tax=Allochromatium palmeri TaxID=231048 RepID=A0A6N8EBH9_9GAMM|nr:Uma2 family endonuclease [Allochromatium palmeri]MTW19694.1 Uma2 family endonuclease [Allochromatium palmeri]